MISFLRGAEPPELRKQRRVRLARAVLARMALQAVTYEGYGVAKDALFRAQHCKCAWCERQIGQRYAALEHVRPKAGAWRGEPSGVRPQTADAPEHYWWLAWTWENLVFTCDECNGEKANWFGLVPMSAPLPAPPIGAALDATMSYFDLSAERPMLVDPTREDPLDHIAWVPEAPVEAPERMRWIPVHRTSRGRYTIDALGLRGGLTDHVTQHIRGQVWGLCVKDVLRLHTRGNYGEARRKWQEGVTSFFAPRAPYHAATYWAMDFFRKKERLRAKDFRLQRPGVSVCVTTPSDDLDPAALARLPGVARLGVRAAANVEEAIVAVLTHGPWTVAQLAELTGRSRATVRSACSLLVKSRRATSPNKGIYAPP